MLISSYVKYPSSLKHLYDFKYGKYVAQFHKNLVVSIIWLVKMQREAEQQMEIEYNQPRTE